METVQFEGEEIEIGAKAQMPFCDSFEAKKLALIEMQKGLVPFNPTMVADYIEHSDDFRLADCFSGEDLESIRRDCLADLVFLDALESSTPELEQWLH